MFLYSLLGRYIIPREVACFTENNSNVAKLTLCLLRLHKIIKLLLLHCEREWCYFTLWLATL